MPTTCTSVSDDARTYAHIKECNVCREAWPMITRVLDTMTIHEIQAASTTDIIKRGLGAPE